MRTFCIAIGIDGYELEDWRLGSCVDDALAFAGWAVRAGGVAPEDVRLLLGPASDVGDNPPSTGTTQLPGVAGDFPFARATREAITKLISTQMTEAGWSTGDRLYFYYAGHGCSHEFARGARPDPVLFPVDVEALPLHAYLLLGFTEVLENLRAYGPKQQFVFIDACRDFALGGYASTAGASTGRYYRPVPPHGDCMQYILYATAPGERAVELGKGVFGAVLLQGLEGHPGALQRLAGQVDYQLTFSRLFSFVRKTVDTQVRRALLATPHRFVQAPESEPDARQPDILIADFAETTVRQLPVHVRVSPQQHLPQASIQVSYERNPYGPPRGPPLRPLTEILLKPSYYGLSATAPGLASDHVVLEVPADGVIELKLKAQTHQAAAAYLRFGTHDATMPIAVFDPNGRYSSALGCVHIANATPGLYRVAALSPDRAPEYKGYVFPECGSQVELEVAAPHLKDTDVAALERVGMTVGTGGLEPAETFGPQAEFRLTSTLAFGAYAAYSGNPRGFHKLRGLNLRPIDGDRSEPWL